MDMAAVSGAVTGLKAAKDLLQVALRTKVALEAAAQIGTALDRLGEVQDSLFDLRDELSRLQQENEELRRQVRARDDWDARLAKYRLATTPGGATVFEHIEAPAHYACPSCRNDRKIQILQDRRVMAGLWDPRWTPQNRPVVDGAKPASGEAVPSVNVVVPRPMRIGKRLVAAAWACSRG